VVGGSCAGGFGSTGGAPLSPDAGSVGLVVDGGVVAGGCGLSPDAAPEPPPPPPPQPLNSVAIASPMTNFLCALISDGSPFGKRQARNVRIYTWISLVFSMRRRDLKTSAEPKVVAETNLKNGNPTRPSCRVAQGGRPRKSASTAGVSGRDAPGRSPYDPPRLLACGIPSRGKP
jgi:hypothetical protein